MTTFPAETETPTTRRKERRSPGKSGSAPIWEGKEYPRLDPGKYLVRGAEVAGPVWVNQYRRWCVRVQFHLMEEPGEVSAFFNLGNDPKGPRVGRQSKFYKAWKMANGGPPSRGEEMSPDIFLDKMMVVSVDDCDLDSEGATKDDDDIYSKITAFHSLVTP